MLSTLVTKCMIEISFLVEVTRIKQAYGSRQQVFTLKLSENLLAYHRLDCTFFLFTIMKRKIVSTILVLSAVAFLPPPPQPSFPP